MLSKPFCDDPELVVQHFLGLFDLVRAELTGLDLEDVFAEDRIRDLLDLLAADPDRVEGVAHPFLVGRLYQRRP